MPAALRIKLYTLGAASVTLKNSRRNIIMKKTMYSFLAALTLAFLVIGCASMNQIRAQNREKLLLLSPGMSKGEVLSAMGRKTITSEFGDVINNPYRTEMYRTGEHTLELLFYYTDMKKADGAITDDELTPIIILDGKLDGWGWSYWENLVQKYEIRIR